MTIRNLSTAMMSLKNRTGLRDVLFVRHFALVMSADLSISTYIHEANHLSSPPGHIPDLRT